MAIEIYFYDVAYHLFMKTSRLNSFLLELMLCGFDYPIPNY